MSTTAPVDRASARTTGVSLAVAGSASVATAFGMARYGYGLLLPDIKHDLALGETALGAIGALAYVTYVAAAAVVARMVQRWGARVTVVGGGLLGAVGTAVIAASTSSAMLAAGIGTAGASAGLVYPPFADALSGLRGAAHGRALAAINCGTGWGVAVAAPIAIVAGSAWRLAYVGFAACSCASTVYAARTLPARSATVSPRRRHRPRAPAGGRRIVVGALLVGLGSGAFWTFAVQQVHDAGLDVTTGRLLLGAAGIGSLVGLVAADVVGRVGLRGTFVTSVLLEATATALLAMCSAAPLPVLAAAFAFGVAYNVAVAVSVLALIRSWARHPASAVARVAGANAVGLLFAPLVGGALSDMFGLTATMLCGAGVLLAAVVGAPARSGDVGSPLRRQLRGRGATNASP